MPKKITQNVNKDVTLNDLPNVVVPSSAWKSTHSNYLSANIGEIHPIYVAEVLPGEKKAIHSGMISHMTTPQAPVFNALYTEVRAFFVSFSACADLLGGYKTRKSPFVKVFGEDPASEDAKIVVPLDEQKLPVINKSLYQAGSKIANAVQASSFGGICDALDYDFSEYTKDESRPPVLNFLSLAGYELIYQKAYRDENRESATASGLYRWLFNLYNRVSDNINFDDSFHIANREKDYFTGAKPFSLKANEPVNVDISTDSNLFVYGKIAQTDLGNVKALGTQTSPGETQVGVNFTSAGLKPLFAKISAGISIEELRLLIKTQELLEKDLMYGSSYEESLNAHFGVKIVPDKCKEPIELFRTTITSHMQPVFQTSTTSGEQTILGSIGANATTEAEFDLLPMTEFSEHGYLIICAVHKAQNAYDMRYFKPKHIFKQSRFDFYTPELNDLGYQKVASKELGYSASAVTPGGDDGAVGYNEAFAEYRYNFNKIHGMLEPSRTNALDYWVLGLSNYEDIQSMYKQGKTELDRALSVTSANAPQFYDAFGFEETCLKPMSLHSIPGMDGVI